MAMGHLFSEWIHKLMEILSHVPEPQSAAVGKQPAGTASRSASTFLSSACGRRGNNVKRDSGRSCWLKAAHETERSWKVQISIAIAPKWPVVITNQHTRCPMQGSTLSVASLPS